MFTLCYNMNIVQINEQIIIKMWTRLNNREELENEFIGEKVET